MILFLLGHLLLTCALAVGSCVVGTRLLPGKWLLAPFERVGLGIALGLGMLGHVATGLGLIGRLDAPTVAVVVAALVVGSAWGRSFHGFPAVEANRRGAIVLAGLIVGAALLATWVLTLYPPTQWDTTSYHLPLARAAADTHHIAPMPYLRYPVMVRHGEMLFAMAYLFGGEAAAQGVQWLMLVTCALLLYAFGRRWFSARAGLWAAAIWLASPMVIANGVSANIDTGLALFSAAAVMALLHGLDRGEPWLFALAGALAGFAASTKYSGLAVLLVLLVALVLARRYRGAAMYLACAIAALAPWYAINAIWSGNPVFPALGQWLGYGGWWSAEDWAGQLADLRAYGSGHSLGALVRLPVDMFVHPRAYRGDAGVSRFLFVWLPLLWIVGRDKRMRRLATILGGLTLCWALGSQVYRYLLPGIALAALVSAAALDAVLSRWRWGRRGWVTALVTLVMLGRAARFTVLEIAASGIPPVTMAERERWLARRVPPSEVFARVPRGKRVYQIKLEDMVYFAGPDVEVRGDWFGPARYAPILARLGDARALHAELSRGGADYLIVPKPSFRAGVALPVEDPAFASLFKLRFENQAASLYEILGQRMPVSYSI